MLSKVVVDVEAGCKLPGRRAPKLGSISTWFYDRYLDSKRTATVDEKTKELLAQLQTYPGVKAEWKKPQSPSALPFIPIGFALFWLRVLLALGARSL